MVCVNAKFVDLFQARFEHLLGGLFQHGKTQNDSHSGRQYRQADHGNLPTLRCTGNLGCRQTYLRAYVFLRQCRAQGHVYDERNRERELQLPQSHEEGFFPERGCCVQAAVLTGAGALPEMGGAQYTKLDARSQPTVDGRAYGKAHGTL